MNKGYFISLEGIEGVGKTTLLNSFHHYLESQGISHKVTREPGGTELGELIRQSFLSDSKEFISVDTEVCLLFAARTHHIHHVIQPSIDRGDWVISDRFIDASYAYQVGGRGFLLSRMKSFEDSLASMIQPDVTCLLDAPVDICLERLKQTKKCLDRIEKEAYPFFSKVRKAYLARAQAEPNRFIIIDANRPIDQVKASLCQAIIMRLKHLSRS